MAVAAPPASASPPEAARFADLDSANSLDTAFTSGATVFTSGATLASLEPTFPDRMADACSWVRYSGAWLGLAQRAMLSDGFTSAWWLVPSRQAPTSIAYGSA